MLKPFTMIMAIKSPSDRQNGTAIFVAANNKLAAHSSASDGTLLNNTPIKILPVMEPRAL